VPDVDNAAVANGAAIGQRTERAPTTETASVQETDRRLWAIADELRANSKLTAAEYSVPVLGLVFLRYADRRFAAAEEQLAAGGPRRRAVGKLNYQARGVLYLPEPARFSSLLNLPEGHDIGRAINEAMRQIEQENEELRGVLPKTYTGLENTTLVALLRLLAPVALEGDAFGRIYEYFLGEFAREQGQLGGEFFTPTAIVKLIVEMIEPFQGRIYDPACGSGGMFVQSARFVERHQKDPNSEIAVFGQEKTTATVRLARMNLAVHGLSGDIREQNTYYTDLHESVKRKGEPGRFDFVMANPPFNVDRVDKERIKDDPRYPFGLPRADNANYLWIQAFYSALNAKGRAGFVMANPAGDARGSEQDIRRQLLQAKAVDAVVAVSRNFFYTVTLSVTLWFLDRGKRGTPREDTVLFIDARSVYRQIDRAHRDFTPEQIEFLANIGRLYRGEEPQSDQGSKALLCQHFPDGRYVDVAGLCKVATLAEIEAQDWSLNPGRYVGVTARHADEFDFFERLEELHEELVGLNTKAYDLEGRISVSVSQILERAVR